MASPKKKSAPADAKRKKRLRTPPKSAITPTSPFATGDFGGRYQDKAGGWFLAHLLMNQPVPGVTRSLSRVAFQRSAQGALLDDVVVTLEDAREIEFSIKAGIKITASDKEFRETLGLAWARTQETAKGAGLVTPVSVPGIKALQRLGFIARQQPVVADFMDAISKDDVIKAESRARFAAARKVLDEAKGSALTNSEYHDFFRRFVVLALDLDLPPASDLGPLLTALQGFQGISAEQARQLYSRLTELSEDTAIASGSWDRPTLIARFVDEGVPFGAPADIKPVITALDAYAKRAREALRDDIADVRIDRTSVVGAAQTALAQGNTCLVTGPSGAGKSVVIGQLYERIRACGPVLYLSGRRVQAAGSWPVLAEDIGILSDRVALARVLKTNSGGITVILDAVEHVQSVGARAAVNDLFAAIASATDVGERPNIVIGTRDHIVPELFGWLELDNVPQLARVKIDVLKKTEASQVAGASPALRQLLARVGANRVTGNLMILRMLSDERIPQASLPTDDASEVDMLDLWWEHVLVGKEALSHARRAIAYEAAKGAVQAPSGLFTLPPSLNADALTELERDGILVVDKTSDRYRFGHDIIQDWAAMRWLNREPEQLVERLDRLVESSGLYRPVSLLAQALFERDVPRYDEMMRILDGTEAKRWQQAFAMAPVVSSRASALLATRAEYLLEDDAERLAALLTVVKVEQSDVAVSQIDQMVRGGVDAPTATAFAAEHAMPRLVVWAPLLRLCLANLGSLKSAAAAFFSFADAWQTVTPPSFVFRAEILDAAFWALEHVEGWRKQGTPRPPPLATPYEDKRAIEKLARSIVAHSTDVDPARIATYLSELVANGYLDAQDDMLEHLGVLGRDLGEAAADFGFAVLSDRELRKPWELDMSELGLRNEYFPPSDVQGPFLTLLRTNEQAGLSLIRRLASHASEHWQRRIANDHSVRFRPLRFRFRNRDIEMFGDERAYGWFRPSAHDSNVLTSALMAVDTWAYQAVKSGRDVVEVANVLLTDTNAVAFLGIVIGLGYDFDALVPEMLDAVTSPWLWRLEHSREKQDYMAAQEPMKMLPAAWQFPEYKPYLAKRNKERDAERAPVRLLLSYAAQLLFGHNGTYQQRFLEARGERTIVDACLLLEEAEVAPTSRWARETEKEFLSKTDPADYVMVGNHVQWRPGAGILPSDEQMRADALRQAILVCDLAGAKALLDYQDPAGLSGFETIGKMAQGALAAGEIPKDDLEYAKHAIVRCAAVAVTFLPRAGGSPSQWSVDVIRETAAAYDARNWDSELDDHQTSDLRLSVATGVGAALAANPDDQEIRRWAFRAVGSGLVSVAAACLRGLIPAWKSRPETPLNALGIIVSLALRPKDGTTGLSDAAMKTFLASDAAKRVQRIPKITPTTKLAAWRVSAALGATPDAFDDLHAVELLRPLVEQLIALVRADYDERKFSMTELLWRVAGVSANIAVALPNAKAAAFTALIGDCSSPEFFASVLAPLVRGHLRFADPADTAFARFSDLAALFFACDHRSALREKWLPSSFRNACWHLVFYEEFEGLMIGKDWPHAARFADHIDRWVNAVGGHPTTAGALIVFLDRFLGAFVPTIVVAWLNTCWATTAKSLRSDFWKRNGDLVAQLLLRMLIEMPSAFQDATLRSAAATLVDELVAAGVPAGGELRKTLENANKR